MDSVSIFNEIVGESAQGRFKSTIGFFVEQELPEAEENLLLDEFYVEKPIVEITEFLDAEGDFYYSFEFSFKSKRDEDLRQQWQFLDKFASSFNSDSDSEESATILKISLIPTSLRGKYSMLVNQVLPDSIVRIETAGSNICSIRLLAFKDDVLFLSHENELVDPQIIEDEVLNEAFATEQSDGSSESDEDI